jgi:peptide/nickel transport system permease protein
MLRLVARRLVAMIPLLLGVVLVTMLLLQLMPGDPAAILAGDNATPEAISQIRTELHLDEPIWERFQDYGWRALHGDLGNSPVSGNSVRSRISVALPITLSLAGVALLFSVVVGVGFGTMAALNQGKRADRVVTAGSSVVQAVPPFVVGLILVIPFAVDRSWFPTSGYVKLGESPSDWFMHLFLPAVTLALGPAAELARQTRAALVDVLEQDFIRVTRAKGLPEHLVIGKHAAKNALTPVVTVFGLQVGRILGGAVVVETIFGLPGFAALALSAVSTRDVVLIQGVVLVSAIFMLVANLLVDVSYGYFNPKVRV